MACALYVHVPFCLRRCVYCGFYSGEPLEWLEAYPGWLVAEAGRRAQVHPGRGPLSSVYFGGGTPSLLGAGGVARVLAAASSAWRIAPGAEVTLEVNPASGADLQALRGAGVNRLSVGVQALDDELLASLGRAHTAAQARQLLRRARGAGFERVSADLLYGLPGLRPESLAGWVRELADLGVSHVSAYSLELHPGTALERAVEEGRARPCGAREEQAQWEALGAALLAARYEAYEVSNFAQTGDRCRHNLAYWEGDPYLALGPGGHGYDPAAGRWGSRWWNEPDLAAYRERVTAGELPPGEVEVLKREEALLEVLFLALRRPAPIEVDRLAHRFLLDRGRLGALLGRMGSEGLLVPAPGGAWRPGPEALRRADGLALWARSVLLEAETLA